MILLKKQVQGIQGEAWRSQASGTAGGKLNPWPNPGVGGGGQSSWHPPAMESVPGGMSAAVGKGRALASASEPFHSSQVVLLCSDPGFFPMV